ncbi:MAG: circumsporozoite protein [Sphingobium sp.]|nr:circumsporozoite protein [Sphingobium sp.]MBP8671468.1 circumsporozoite protein [Sphingobium sp.]MBP9158554.1 circumsporozoite protein [Sphingobium sp.]MCC6480849.1 circumsporozoite protein [Sphingomonadaceae bacterium]
MKKTIALSLVIAASLGLAACSKSEEGNNAMNNAVENVTNAADNAVNAAMNAGDNVANAAGNAANATNAM